VRGANVVLSHRFTGKQDLVVVLTANLVKIGDRVEISDPTGPEIKLSATVNRTSRELDPKTRTMLVEIKPDNRAEPFLASSS
jgi:hypothetical protein